MKYLMHEEKRYNCIISSLSISTVTFSHVWRVLNSNTNFFCWVFFFAKSSPMQIYGKIMQIITLNTHGKFSRWYMQRSLLFSLHTSIFESMKKKKLQEKNNYLFQTRTIWCYVSCVLLLLCVSATVVDLIHGIHSQILEYINEKKKSRL